MNKKAKKKIAIFGATGSIGRQTLDVVDRLGGYDVALLSARSRWRELVESVEKYRPEYAVISDDRFYRNVKEALAGVECNILAGEDANAIAAQEADYDLCVNGLVGVSGLLPSCHSLLRGKESALANKESLVLAGDLLNEIARRNNTEIIPIDSEHSAIMQCLQGEKIEQVKRLILTASGGPFRTWALKDVKAATPEQALKHPTWKMGAKITVDSATLMNKGLEVIEAYHLFHIPPDKIDVRIHPTSIVHSMVEFSDGSFKAQLGKPDMRLPIQYALTYPDRMPMEIRKDDPVDWGALEFFHVDRERYPCLDLAFKALRMGGTAPAVLNGADESTVEAFLAGKIPFGKIAQTIESVLQKHSPNEIKSIEDVLEADAFGRGEAMRLFE